MFSDKLDGWQNQKWWERVQNIGPTLTIVKSSAGKICCGYTEALWQNIAFASDPKSFLLSVTNRKKFLPINPECAVYMEDKQGPNFGLGVLHVAEGPFLNGENKSSCHTDTEAYQIQVDSQGRSLLTGEKDNFTCVAIETFFIEY